MMQKRISIYDFSFSLWDFGSYWVAFESRKTGKRWGAIINDMPLIDATKNNPYPKLKDLDALRDLVKSKSK